MNKLTRTSKASAQDVQVKQGSETELIGGGTTRIGLWALILGFGGFLIWASFAPLDEGVPGQGIIAIDTKRKAVQHLNGGIIREVLVREGELVKEGQVLVRMDEAVTKETRVCKTTLLWASCHGKQVDCRATRLTKNQFHA